MKQWFRKIATLMIAIITLGIYIPPSFSTSDMDQDKQSLASKSTVNEALYTLETESIDYQKNKSELLNIQTNQDAFLSVMAQDAKEQTFLKFGSKITNKIGNDFSSTILPQMESVLGMILEEIGEEQSIYFGITENPIAGYGEKIFNIYDYRTQKDIARFDVRRENRPLDGYWFSFHYHLSQDNFEKHYELGDIFWDKNMPPKWMA